MTHNAITIKEVEELVKKSFATTNDKFDKINMTLDELMKNNSVEGIDAVKKSIKGLQDGPSVTKSIKQYVDPQIQQIMKKLNELKK